MPGPRTVRAAGAGTPTPFLHFADFLDHRELQTLLDCMEAQAARLPIDPPPSVSTETNTQVGQGDLSPVWSILESRLRPLAGHLRRELGLEHFVLEGLNLAMTVYEGSTTRSATGPGPRALGTPRISFLCPIEPPGSSGTGGAVRLYDSVETDGVIVAADTFTEIPALSNAIVFFPSDRHHEVARVGPAGDGPLLRYVVSGSFVGDPHEPESADVEVLRTLQHRYVPTLSESGFEVRATPAPVQQLLESLLLLRGRTRRDEAADPRFHRNGSPDLVDVSDLGADILHWLQPVHEEFARVPLVPSNVYGMRIYVSGNTLDLHVDRPDTHVISSVLQVAQDVDEPWPLVIERENQLHQVYLAPGQMVLYEGAASDHGRPTPLRGRSFVNLFVHYRPVDWPWTVAKIETLARQDGLLNAARTPKDHTSV